jgi:hypothetical protein
VRIEGRGVLVEGRGVRIEGRGVRIGGCRVRERRSPACARGPVVRAEGRTLEGAQAAIGCAVDAIAPWGDAITLEVAAIHLKVDGIGSEEVALLLGEAA